jgi:hypothetical protein
MKNIQSLIHKIINLLLYVLIGLFFIKIIFPYMVLIYTFYFLLSVFIILCSGCIIHRICSITEQELEETI